MTASVERVLQGLGFAMQRNGARWWLEQCPMPDHGPHNPAHRFKNFFVRDDMSSHNAREFHCFSCKASGKLVELVMAVRRCTFKDALDWLMSLDDGSASVAPYLRVRVEPFDRGMRFRLPEGVESLPFDKWNSVPRRYVESRGITVDQVERWRIGYALLGRLQGRIVLPVHNEMGRLVNYTARTFCDHEVRYLSAAEEEGPDTSAFWGEHTWPDPEARTTVILFEGAINGMAIERVLQDAGWQGVYLAGMSGSLFDHKKTMRLRGWRHIVCAADPDKAGDAVHRAIESAYRHAPVCVTRMRYPDKRDANDLAPAELLDTLSVCLASPDVPTGVRPQSLPTNQMPTV